MNSENTQSSVPCLVTPLPGPRARALIESDERYTSPSYTRVYPLAVERAQGAVVEDVDGNRFLDFTAGIAVCSTGHCHPQVVEAIQRQAAKLLHMSGTDFYYAPQRDLAKKLAEIAPGDVPKRVFFTNSGAEAIEAAFKLARFHTGRKHMIAFFGAFHGRTMGALALTGSKATQRAGFAPLIPEVTHVEFPNPLRGPTVDECMQQIERDVFGRTVPPEEVAAFVVEPIQGEGGYIVPPPDFHPRLKALAERHGICYVVDEVQSGMGRTGRMFAIEHTGVVPDIVCLAKGIASGMPLGAIIARADIMDWPPGSHGSTFGGNPVSCVAALATIDLLERGLIENARRTGDYLRARLTTLAAERDTIAEVRGVGLMLGVEIVSDRRSMRPAPDERNRIVRACFEQGLLLLGCGESTVRFCPPLIVTERDADTAVDIFEAALAAG
ncbi:MAG TPA: acetyl ornithine aminotransferase family protein [Gammaproteobacteria bacterium]|nr:acetyl ornithine aminotransferase family protein [Gammaproteobacteria bacterium]